MNFSDLSVMTTEQLEALNHDLHQEILQLREAQALVAQALDVKAQEARLQLDALSVEALENLQSSIARKLETARQTLSNVGGVESTLAVGHPSN